VSRVSFSLLEWFKGFVSAPGGVEGRGRKSSREVRRRRKGSSSGRDRRGSRRGGL